MKDGVATTTDGVATTTDGVATTKDGVATVKGREQKRDRRRKLPSTPAAAVHSTAYAQKFQQFPWRSRLAAAQKKYDAARAKTNTSTFDAVVAVKTPGKTPGKTLSERALPVRGQWGTLDAEAEAPMRAAQEGERKDEEAFYSMPSWQQALVIAERNGGKMKSFTASAGGLDLACEQDQKVRAAALFVSDASSVAASPEHRTGNDARFVDADAEGDGDVTDDADDDEIFFGAVTAKEVTKRVELLDSDVGYRRQLTSNDASSTFVLEADLRSALGNSEALGGLLLVHPATATATATATAAAAAAAAASSPESRHNRQIAAWEIRLEAALNNYDEYLKARDGDGSAGDPHAAEPAGDVGGNGSASGSNTDADNADNAADNDDENGGSNDQSDSSGSHSGEDPFDGDQQTNPYASADHSICTDFDAVLNLLPARDRMPAVMQLTANSVKQSPTKSSIQKKHKIRELLFRRSLRRKESRKQQALARPPPKPTDSILVRAQEKEEEAQIAALLASLAAAAPAFPTFESLTGRAAKTAASPYTTAPSSPTSPTSSAPRSPSPSTKRRRKSRVSFSLPRRLSFSLPLPRPLSWFKSETVDVGNAAGAPGWQPSGLASILTARAGLPPTIMIGCI